MRQLTKSDKWIIGAVLGLVVAIALLMAVTGCATKQAPVEQGRIEQARSQLVDMQRTLATQPASPERDRDLKLIAVQLKGLLAAEAAARVAADVQAGVDPGPAVGAGVALIPGAAVFAPLAGLGASIVWGIVSEIKKRRAQENLANVVNSIERAAPDWSDEDKVKIAALQGTATSAAVAEIKRELGLEKQ